MKMVRILETIGPGSDMFYRVNDKGRIYTSRTNFFWEGVRVTFLSEPYTNNIRKFKWAFSLLLRAQSG